MRITMALAVACLVVGMSVAAQADSGLKRYDLNIPRQSLDTALKDLAQQTGLQIARLSDTIDGAAMVGPVNGSLTPQQALDNLLSAQGLSYTVVNERTIAIVKAGDPMAGNLPSATTLRLTQNDQNVRGTENQNTPSSVPEEAEDMRLQEIIVTAQKRQQRLIEVPISITALSGEALEQAGIDDMQSLSFAVPGMATQEIGPGRQNIAIRGLGTTKGSSSLVGVYLDEMPLSGPQDGFVSTYIDLPTLDLERVEVLKGPQGTLFGEGSVGGTIRFVTKDPQLDRVGGDVSASLLSTDNGGWTEEATGVLNVPVVEGKFGLRLATTYANSDGWVDRLQTVNGPVIEEDFNDHELLDTRLKALWLPMDGLTVKAMAVVHRSEGGGSNIVNVGRREDSNFIIEFEPTAPTDFSDDYELYNLTSTYDFKAMQLLSSTSYADMSSTASFFQRRPIIPNTANPNGGFQEILQRDYALDSSAFSQELRLSSTGAGPLKWTLGAFYKDAELISDFVSGTDFIRFGVPLVLRAGAGQKATTKSESRTAFGDVSYALTERVEVGGGLRYFEDDREVFSAGAANVASTFLSGSFNATTFRSYLSYAISADVRVYGSAATGFRSGGFNATATVAVGGPVTYDPEEVISYELGTKMNLADGRVHLETALFYSNWLDMQGPNFFNLPNGTPTTYTANVGEAEMKGIEWSVSWVATERLTLTQSGDITETEVTKIGLVANPPVFVGDPIDMVPDYSLSFGADYGFHWSSLIPGYARVQFNQQGQSMQTSRSIDSPLKQESTPVLRFLNVSTGADWNGWGIEVFLRNLLNEDGALRAGSGLASQARPRTVGVKFAKSF